VGIFSPASSAVAPTWSVVLGFVGDFVIKAIGAVIVAMKVCDVPGVCAK
jgi:hypothetical protein